MNHFLDAFNLTSLLMAFFGGLLIGLPTGPARFFVIDTALKEGRDPALRVYGGFLVASLLYAGLALLLDDLISSSTKVESASYFIASLLLVFWGVFIILKSNKENRSSIELGFGSPFVKGFLTGSGNLVTPFIFLAFLQLLKLYSGEISLYQKIAFILIFQLFSFLATSAVALILMKKKDRVLGFWRGIKVGMGIMLISFGAYNSYKQLDLTDGIRIKKSEGFLEEQINNN